MPDGQFPPTEDRTSVARQAVPRAPDPGDDPATPAHDLALDATRAELQSALDSEGSGAIDVVTSELDSLLAELEHEITPPRTADSGSDSGSDSGMIDLSVILGPQTG